MQTNDFTKEDVDSLLSEGNTEFEEEIKSAQVPRQNTFKKPPTEWSKQGENATGTRTSPPKPAPTLKDPAKTGSLTLFERK